MMAMLATADDFHRPAAYWFPTPGPPELPPAGE